MSSATGVLLLTDVSAAMVPTITPSSYYINNYGYWYDFNEANGNSSTLHTVHVGAQIQGSELGGVGFIPIFDWGGIYDTAQYFKGVCKYSNKTAAYKRWANDWNASNLLNPKNSRAYFIFAPVHGGPTTGGTIPGLISVVTYHGITKTASGTVINYTGNGSGITVTIHRSDTGEKIATATTAVGGSYTVTEVFDDTIQHFSEARQDGTHLGRSELYTPV
jgi:hypothetical protein